MRSARVLMSLVTAAVVVGCASEPTAVVPDQESLDAAAEYSRVADSLAVAGVDAGIVAGYRALAVAVRDGGPSSSVVISVDGQAAEFRAVAREVAFEPGPACVDPMFVCTSAPLRTLIAWQRSNPRRVVQLIGDHGWMTAGTTVNGITSFGQLPDLSYFDGAGGYFTGTASAKSISEPIVSDIPCWNEMQPTTTLRVTCRRAQFTASFAGTVSPSLLTGPPNSATATRRLAMTPQGVAGVRTVLGQPTGGQIPPPFFPPISLRGPVLPATITAAVGPAGVTFTLTITNPGGTAADLRFSNGQQYDFAVRRADGTPVWRWSVGISFIAALTSRSLAPGESVAYAATWSNATPGSYVAVGALTSTSHRAEASASFVVP